MYIYFAKDFLISGNSIDLAESLLKGFLEMGAALNSFLV